MPRYDHVQYGKVCAMIEKVVAIKGTQVPLTPMVNDLSRYMKLGIDTTRVKRMLGDKVVEKVELINNVAVVEDVVIP